MVRVQVRRSGKSACVRIPGSVLTAASMHIDQAVDIREENGRIIIEPVKTPTYDLDTLLAAMAPETFPDDIDFGPPAGGEIW
jgi:antitoxin MazE